jgi:hypothetical protein
MWEGRSEEQTVNRPNSSSSYSYFLMIFDKFWPYDRLILLNNIVCDVTEVCLLHILSDYVSFPFQFENKHQVKVVSRSTWRHQNGAVWCPGRLQTTSLPGCSGCYNSVNGCRQSTIRTIVWQGDGVVLFLWISPKEKWMNDYLLHEKDIWNRFRYWQLHPGTQSSAIYRNSVVCIAQGQSTLR